MMGKVSTDESRNEISSSPGPPSVVAKATIFTFHAFNQENKYPPTHLKCCSSRAKASGGSTPLLRSQPYLRLTPYHPLLRALCASVLNFFPSSLRPLCLCVKSFSFFALCPSVLIPSFSIRLTLHPSEHRPYRLFYHVVHPMQFICRNHVRRQHIHHISQRTQQHAVLQKKSIQFRPHRRKIARIVSTQFNRAHRSNLPRLANHCKIAKLRQSLRIDLRDRRNLIKHRFILKNLQ